jgi:outer membrane protein X
MKKKIFMAALAFSGIFIASAQTETRIGGMLAYGTEIENLGIGANAEFGITEKLSISPGFIFYLPKDEYGIDITWWEINANANYYFMEGNTDVYGLAGLNYTSVKISYPDNPFFDGDVSDGRFGLNIGGGANFHIGSSILPFAELKYVIIDGGQLVLAAGVKFSL